MTTNTDVVNRALQAFGSRTTVTATELTNASSNEAIQANLIIEELRKTTLRMAPWDCAFNYNNLTYITSAPGTPENTSAGTTLWVKGQPPPPWIYEYQYPVDCLRACFIVPQFMTGFAGGVPITTAVTGGATSFWQGPPVKFKVAIDQFIPVTSAAVANGGTGHAVGDVLTLVGTTSGSAPIGAPVQLTVATVAAGVILTVTVVNQVIDASPSQGGSYFEQQTNPVAMDTSTGSGIDATFTLTYGAKASQRTILTNQEYALLGYVKDLTDLNVMDPMFLDAWAFILGARICLALTGDKVLANNCVERANQLVIEARKADGNEGLTLNDVTPDWLRARGLASADGIWTPSSYEWGNLFPVF